jgi:hypothetical protein
MVVVLPLLVVHEPHIGVSHEGSRYEPVGVIERLAQLVDVQT